MNANQEAELMALMDKGMDDHEKRNMIASEGWNVHWKVILQVGDQRQIFRRALPFEDAVKLVQKIKDIQNKR